MSRLNLDALPRLRLEDFDLGIAEVDLLFEPLTRDLSAMPQQDGPRRNSPNELNQLFTIGVGRQIKILDLTSAGHLAAATTEEKFLLGPGSFETSAGSVGISVTDEEDGLLFVPDHPQSQIMRGGLFAHHPGREDEEASAGELHFIELAFFWDD